MDLIKDFKNELLNRREVKGIVTLGGNPGFAEAEKILSEELKADLEKVVVKNVISKFGRDTFLIDAFVYDSKEHKERIEPKIKVKEKKK